MCGIFAVTNNAEAARLTYFGLFALQHRGQESAGLALVAQNESGAANDKEKIICHRGSGQVPAVFSEEALRRLEGKHCIGHVRYSTSGKDTAANIQPLFARIHGVDVAIAHNGNIVNADIIRKDLERRGAIFQGTTDTEIILHLLAQNADIPIEERLENILPQLVGAVNILLLTPTHLYAYVDPLGYRPLVLGRLENSQSAPSWVLASETCALDLVGADFLRNLEPGELLSIELATQKLTSKHLNFLKDTSVYAPLMASCKSANSACSGRRYCSFEHIYFARPDSALWGKSTSLVRNRLGAILARESPVAHADCVVPVPDSGVAHAMGYAEAAGLPLRFGLIRNHYVGRTFIEPTQFLRNLRVKLKLNPVREIVEGKSIVLVDDSLVRGTTARNIIQILRDAGAREIHFRLASPPVRFPCFYGIDTPKRQELLAQNMDLESMRVYLGVDSLAFLSLEGLREALAQDICDACFSGCYADTFAQEKARH